MCPHWCKRSGPKTRTDRPLSFLKGLREVYQKGQPGVQSPGPAPHSDTRSAIRSSASRLKLRSEAHPYRELQPARIVCAGVLPQGAIDLRARSVELRRRIHARELRVVEQVVGLYAELRAQP